MKTGKENKPQQPQGDRQNTRQGGRGGEEKPRTEQNCNDR